MREEDIQSRMNLQIPPEERMKAAKVVINTDVNAFRIKKVGSRFVGENQS